MLRASVTAAARAHRKLRGARRERLFADSVGGSGGGNAGGGGGVGDGGGGDPARAAAGGYGRGLSGAAVVDADVVGARDRALRAKYVALTTDVPQTRCARALARVGGAYCGGGARGRSLGGAPLDPIAVYRKRLIYRSKQRGW